MRSAKLNEEVIKRLYPRRATALSTLQAPLCRAREQIANACEALGIRRICLSTLRHHAIACMKRSGYTRQEIAAIVNHASDRTAGEKYGKARTGSRRARKRLQIDPARIALVRTTARTHGQKRKPAPR